MPRVLAILRIACWCASALHHLRPGARRAAARTYSFVPPVMIPAM